MFPESAIISDAELFAYEKRAEGQVVIVTGGAVGLGKAGAIDFAKRGSKVVVGDIDTKNGEQTAQEIREAGGASIFRRCDVTKWDDLVSLFEAAWAEFGSVDVVVANAGINESQDFMDVRIDDKGKPRPPNIKTIEINLISLVNTAHLAIYYFNRNKKADSLKALVLVGSIASITAMPGCPQYTGAKHGVLGFMKGLRARIVDSGMRIAMVAPWFVDTAILNTANQMLIAGLPKTPAYRVAGAMFLAATDEDPETNCAAYILPDEREVVRVPHTQLTEGIYELLNNRVKRVFNLQANLRIYAGIVKVILGLPGTKYLGILSLCFAGSRLAIAKGWV